MLYTKQKIDIQFFSAGLMFLLFVLLIVLSSCDSPVDPVDLFTNPNDSLSTVFIPAKTILLAGPTQDSIITAFDPTVTFEWSAPRMSSNKDYSWKITSGEWSAWSTDTAITFHKLDEGEYRFSVRARHMNLTTIEDSFPTVHFTVDAVKGPALMFLPRYIEAGRRDSFIVNVKVEEATAFSAVKVVVQYDKTVFFTDISSIKVFTDTSSILKKTGGDIIDIPEIDTLNGIITMNIVSSGGSPLDVAGTGFLGKIKFKTNASIAQSKQITFLTTSIMRTSSKTDVVLKNRTPLDVVLK